MSYRREKSMFKDNKLYPHFHVSILLFTSGRNNSVNSCEVHDKCMIFWTELGEETVETQSRIETIETETSKMVVSAWVL